MVLAVAMSPLSMHSMPSRRSSLRNFGSRSTRARMVSLKSRDRAMLLLLFSPFIIVAAGNRCFDILLLPLLGAAAQQDDKALSVLAEVNSVARTKIDAALKHARTDTLDVREIALRQAGSTQLSPSQPPARSNG